MLSLESEQRTQEVRAIRQVRELVVDDFDLVALQYGDIHELFGFLVATVLHNQQARSDHFKYGTRPGKVASRTPDEELLILPPNAEVNSGALYCRSKPRQGLRRQGHPP